MPLLTLLRDRKWTSYQGLDRKWERDWIIRLNSFSISQQSQLDTALICSRKGPRPAMHFFHSRPYIFSKPNRHTENLFSGIRNQPINDLKASRLFKFFCHIWFQSSVVIRCSPLQSPQIINNMLNLILIFLHGITDTQKNRIRVLPLNLFCHYCILHHAERKGWAQNGSRQVKKRRTKLIWFLKM